jgi:NMD protein affecting ribosome stability and mRNA decay
MTLKAIPKNKKCRCGKEIKHHHFLCDECWKEDKNTSELKKKAMEKNKEGMKK